MRTKNDSEDGFKEIKAVPFNQDGETSAAAVNVNTLRYKTPGLIFGLAALLIGIIVVVFFLPDWVKKNNSAASKNLPKSTTVSSIPSVSEPSSSALPSPPDTAIKSPAEVARDVELRKEAQNHLQDILEKQNTLKQNNAQIWSAEKYAAGQNHAAEGDQFYNQQQFLQANTAYKNALLIFDDLVDQIDILYHEKIEQGQQALDSGESMQALSAFEMASLFTDESLLAAKGLQRARKLDEVFMHIEHGNEALNEGRLNDAKNAFQAALELDNETKVARQKLEETNNLLANNQFNAHMTAGYAALEQQRYGTASNEFKHALKIQPASTSAKTALQQTKHQAITLEISNTLQQATDNEKNEQWQKAIELYDYALKLENNLTQAQIGKQRAQRQLLTRQKLDQILSQPERLSNKNIHAEATAYYTNTIKLDNQGPILTKQLNELKTLLEVSATPVTIRLESDNATNVTIYKVGKMGLFKSTELSLRPGKYVAVGKRDGYRDIRVEFLVSQNTMETVIRIAANEKIN
jgi:tetratricopeptide (TPR) repeat protein